jgi:hypothetical protein
MRRGSGRLVISGFLGFFPFVCFSLVGEGGRVVVALGLVLGWVLPPLPQLFAGLCCSLGLCFLWVWDRLGKGGRKGWRGGKGVVTRGGCRSVSGTGRRRTNHGGRECGKRGAAPESPKLGTGLPNYPWCYEDGGCRGQRRGGVPFVPFRGRTSCFREGGDGRARDDWPGHLSVWIGGGRVNRVMIPCPLFFVVSCFGV